jgi:8-oxo-dGTP pyrophosphatase MutT (NUDIX family)/phosphohistidine phosphatase SixA
MSTVVRAAGGVLWRPGDERGVRVAVVHRPRYDDWSLPKGKLDPGELHLAAACREACEETGFDVVAGRTLGISTYRVLQDGRDVAKHVRWWAMRAVGGEFAPHDEVDRLDWLTPSQSLRRLGATSYAEPLRQFLSAPPTTATVLVVRHASAGDRASWPGGDDDRPLDEQGRRQAEALRDLLLHYGPRRVVSAPLRRCVDTVRPLADALGVEVEELPALTESAHAQDRTGMAEHLRKLVDPAVPTVVCSQGGAIPDSLQQLVPPDVLPDGELRAKKASTWALSFVGDQVVDADYTATPLP